MKPFSIESITIGFTIAILISIRGKRRKSLSNNGAVTAFLVGFTSVACGGNRGYLLFLFYQLGTAVTKFCKDEKCALDGEFKTASLRSPAQVLACSGIAVCLSLAHGIFYGEEVSIDFQMHPGESSLTCAIIAHYCTCCGDTFASEIGMLSKSKPFLITAPWRTVPHGTNGGVTIWGTLWSGIGGFMIGLGFIFLDKVCSGFDNVQIYYIMVYSTSCGLFGSCVDSILGATLQTTYYDENKKLVYCKKEYASLKARCISGCDCLSNAQVNFFSVLVTTLVGGFWLAPKIFN